LKRSTLLFVCILAIIIVVPLFLAVFTFDNQSSEPEFFVGVEYAIDNKNVEACKALVDRTKNFTNLFVVDSYHITRDLIALNEICDYVYDAGLYFLVFFVSPIGEGLQLQYNFFPHLWITDAKEKYGEKFLGIYAMDEPGGNQLDRGSFRMVNPEDIENTAQTCSVFLEYLDYHIDYFTYMRRYEDITVLTADYGLYWFDYKAGYDTVLVEFGWNHSRPLHVALCRGAANAQNMEWGMIETWTYYSEPYLGSAEMLYDDLLLAYHNGAKYAVIFDYPNTSFSDYGTLTDEHFGALENFWDYINQNPSKHGIEKAEVAYVLPENFGYAFRKVDDKIWGLDPCDLDEMWGDWTATELAEKVWSDVNQLLDEYGSSLDIVYSDPEFDDNVQQKYEQLFFWNLTLN
jgi:hypothetical protein